MEKRNTSFDLLRILSTISVIIIHINASYFDFVIDINSPTSIIQNVLNIVLRFSVPCFVMMSGAFILRNPKNRNFRYFYSKTFYKLGIPFLVTLLFLLSVSEVSQVIGEHKYFSPIRSILIGDYYNLWYMFMLMGIYFLVPFIIRIKEIMPKKVYLILSISWLILGVINQSTSKYLVSYSFGTVFSYLGYFLIGDNIYARKKENGNAFKAVIMAVLIIAFTVLTFMIRWLTGISIYFADPYCSFFSPLIVLISICMFTMFTNINIKLNLSKLSAKTYNIYLIHTFCYNMILTILKGRIIVNTIFMIMLVSLLTFIISWLISTTYIHICNLVEKKLNLKGQKP